MSCRSCVLLFCKSQSVLYEEHSPHFFQIPQNHSDRLLRDRSVFLRSRKLCESLGFQKLLGTCETPCHVRTASDRFFSKISSPHLTHVRLASLLQFLLSRVCVSILTLLKKRCSLKMPLQQTDQHFR